MRCIWGRTSRFFVLLQEFLFEFFQAMGDKKFVMNSRVNVSDCVRVSLQYAKVIVKLVPTTAIIVLMFFKRLLVTGTIHANIHCR